MQILFLILLFSRKAVKSFSDIYSIAKSHDKLVHEREFSNRSLIPFLIGDFGGRKGEYGVYGVYVFFVLLLAAICRLGCGDDK